MSPPAPAPARRPGPLLAPALLAIAPPALLAWWWAGESPERLLWLGRLLYWWPPVTLAFAGLCFAWRFRARTTSIAAFVRANAVGFAVALVATVALFWLVPPTMRVQFDETSLLGTSQNMHLQRQAVMTTGAVPSMGELVRIENMVDKRPTLFAFLVSVVHDVTGYRVANAFAVNGALLVLGLSLLFAGVRARLGVLPAVTAQLLVLGVPLTGVVATSAGFELLATVLLVAATMAALDFVARPDDARFAALVGCGALLAQARYESVVALAVLVVPVAIVTWRRYRPGRRAWWLLAACPTLVAPLFVLLDHARDPNFTPEASGQALVSLAHLGDHAGPLLAAWLDPVPRGALPGPLAELALVAWLARLGMRRAGVLDLLVAAPTLLVTLVALLWFYGDVREPTALRLFLPLAWLTPVALLAAMALRGRSGRRMTFAALAVALLLLGVRGAQLVRGEAFPELRIAALTRELDRAVARLPGDRATTLWVGAPAQHLIVKGHAAISVRTFLRLGDGVARLMQQRDVRAVYLVETPLDGAMAPAFGAPRELLSRLPSEVVERVGGAMPLTVHRLGR